MREKFLEAIKRKPMTLSELCRKTKISNAWANKLKFKLLKEGIIELEQLDGRSKLIKLK